MTILWTDTTAAFATSGETPKDYAGTWEAKQVKIDSRSIEPGDLFVAIKGENFDGHDFVKDALVSGAVAAIVSRIPEGLGKAKLLLVDDTMMALENLGKVARKHSKAKIVGVTGSVGKTSSKEMIRLALSAHGETYATAGNTNNHIGTPLNLANMPVSAEFAVFEMGMNHAGEISHLTKMVKPHVAAITTVEAVHSEFFDSVEGIAAAKCEIFEGMQSGSVAILNRDNPHYAFMSRRASEQGVNIIITFGSHEKSDCRLISYEPGPAGCRITASIYGKHLTYSLKAIGKHWAYTSLLTLAVTHSLRLDDEKTARALAAFGELAGRGSITTLAVAGGEAVLIDDSYNASPAAMRAAFSKTNEVWEGRGRKGRKLAALGNMLELGQEAKTLHTGLAPDIERAGFSKVFTAGELMQHLHNVLPMPLQGGHVAKASDLLPLLLRELKPGDILLVKGSHGSKIYELAKALSKKAPLVTEMEKMHAV